MAPVVVILSESDAQRHQPSGREVCISVTGPDKPVPTLSEQFLAILRVAFSDITEPIDHPDYILFNERHAEEILRFALQWRNVDRIVIHCQAGLSRSPGIALGLGELFGWPMGDLEQQKPLWNSWVRGELVRVGRAVMASDVVVKPESGE